MRINTNISSMIAINTRSKNVALAGNSSEKLSVGKKIVKAKDDASGMAISDKMESQIRGLDTSRQALDEAKEVLGVYDGALEQVGDMCGRIRELCVQAGSDTLTQEDRDKIVSEINQLAEEMYNVSIETEYNNKKLFTGNGYNIPSGANGEARQIHTVYMSMGVYSFITQANGGTPPTIDNVTAKISGIDIKLNNGEDARNLINSIDALKDPIINSRTNLGAISVRLEHARNNNEIYSTNLNTSKSRIVDLDIVKETVALTKHNLLVQSSQAIVGQSKSFGENIVNLLK